VLTKNKLTTVVYGDTNHATVCGAFGVQQHRLQQIKQYTII
jgi:hypothetical protein